MNINEIHLNPSNPRYMTEAKKEKLKNNIKVINNLSEYKNIGGIYVIYNSIDDRCYIGSSLSIKDRIMMHRRDLRAGKHHSKYLQNFYNKYGEDLIEFGILEKIEDKTKKNLIDTEQKYLDTFKPEFNINKKADSRQGVINSPEHRKRASETKLAMHIKYDDEYKKRMSILLSGKNNPMFGMGGELSPNWGKKHKPETIKKMIESHRDVRGKNNPKYGIPQSPEATAKALITKRQRKLLRGRGIKVIKDGKIIAIFQSSGEAAPILGISQSSILRVCNGAGEKCKGFVFEFTGGTICK